MKKLTELFSALGLIQLVVSAFSSIIFPSIPSIYWQVIFLIYMDWLPVALAANGCILAGLVFMDSEVVQADEISKESKYPTANVGDCITLKIWEPELINVKEFAAEVHKALK